jgi:hypothetical protein
MQIFNTRTHISVGLKFGLEAFPGGNYMKVTAEMRILNFGKFEMG